MENEAKASVSEENRQNRGHIECYRFTDFVYIYGINYAFMKENFHKTFLTTCEAAFSLFKMNR